jgi:transaldolase
MNVVQRLEHLGQSIWYDNISRGVTSNPTIFEKAISGSTDYEGQIRDLVKNNRTIPVGDIIQSLMIKDIQMAADILLPVYERTGGRDGYVSVEVTPGKARDTRGTIEEVRLLWARISRKNLMVKIPATKEGLPAIEQAIVEGMNINVTLIFAVDRYREVANAYINGLERRMKAGKPLDRVASVASVFVSRIDSLVDDLLQKKVAGGSPGDAGRLRSLMGVAAIANTKLVYHAFREMFDTQRFSALKAHGAHVQRPLWGSTSTKNPAYDDLIYVDTLIGPDTVNTVPPPTYTAILDHGQAVLTVETALDEARAKLRELAAAGIDMAWVTQKLEEDGVASFEKSFDGLYQNLEVKRSEFSHSDAG